MAETIPYTIPVPSEMDAQVRERMQSGGFNSRAEYVRAAIRADLERSAQQQLEDRLLKALDRGDYQDAPTFLAQLRATISNAVSE